LGLGYSALLNEQHLNGAPNRNNFMVGAGISVSF
jgi:hypothetical protein